MTKFGKAERCGAICANMLTHLCKYVIMNPRKFGELSPCTVKGEKDMKDVWIWLPASAYPDGQTARFDALSGNENFNFESNL